MLDTESSIKPYSKSTKKCKFCGETFFWRELPYTGRFKPINLDGSSHATTCKNKPKIMNRLMNQSLGVKEWKNGVPNSIRWQKKKMSKAAQANEEYWKNKLHNELKSLDRDAAHDPSIKRERKRDVVRSSTGSYLGGDSGVLGYRRETKQDHRKSAVGTKTGDEKV